MLDKMEKTAVATQVVTDDKGERVLQSCSGPLVELNKKSTLYLDDSTLWGPW